jgi:hypothetical protein
MQKIAANTAANVYSAFAWESYPAKGASPAHVARFSNQKDAEAAAEQLHATGRFSYVWFGEGDHGSTQAKVMGELIGKPI